MGLDNTRLDDKRSDVDRRDDDKYRCPAEEKAMEDGIQLSDDEISAARKAYYFQLHASDDQEYEKDESTKEVREQIVHNFLDTGLIHDLLYNTNVEKLRKVQQKTLLGLVKMLFQGIDEGYIKLPTGTGKTLFFSEVLYALQLPSWLLAPTSDLIGQNMSQLLETGYQSNQLFSIPEMKYNEEEKQFIRSSTISAHQALLRTLQQIEENNIHNAVVGSTYASGKSLYKNSEDLLQRLITFMKIYISDEGHETMGRKGDELKEFFMDREHGNPHGKVHIILTATPERRKKSLKDRYHEIISIKLQECFEDEILIRPGFAGVGKAYLPLKGGLEKKPSNYEIESSGKFINEEGRPIREVMIDKHASLLEKFVYFPTKYFCKTIAEAKDVEKYAKEVHGLRVVVQTSENDITDADIGRMVYHDEIDAVINVKKGVQGSDCRPLRCAVRFNASNDPVYKTQGNGRIMRTMKEEDVEEVFHNLRPKEKYKAFDDDQLRNIIRKDTTNTLIIEPDKWVLTIPRKGKLPRGAKGTGKKKPAYQPTISDPIDELPNSLEDMFLCDEVDSSYLAHHYPNATVHFSDIKEFFEKEKITSLEDLLLTDVDKLLDAAGERFRGAKYQRIKLMLSARSLEGLNAIADFMGYTPMTQQQVDKIYKKCVKEQVQSKNIVDLYKYKTYQRADESPARLFIWRIKLGQDIRRENSFSQIMNMYGVNVPHKIRTYIGRNNPIDTILKGDEKYEELFDLTNERRKEDGLERFAHDVKKEKFFDYLGEKCGFQTMKQYIFKVLEINGINSPDDLLTNRRIIYIPEFNKIYKELGWEKLGVRALFSSSFEFKKGLMNYLYGKETTDEIIYKKLIDKLIIKQGDVYTLFDVISKIYNSSAYSGVPAREVKAYFGYNARSIPMEKLKKLAEVGIKNKLIQIDSIENLDNDVSLAYQSRLRGYPHKERKESLEKKLGIDKLRKAEWKKRLEENKKMQKEYKKKKAEMERAAKKGKEK